MADLFVGIDGVARAIRDCFVGIDGVARRVKAAYIGVDGKARLFYGGWYLPAVNETVVSLSEGQIYNTGVLFAPGRYEVKIAGKPTTESTFPKNNCFTVQTVINKPFLINAVISTSVTDSFTTGLCLPGNRNIFGGYGGYSALTAGADILSVDQQGSLDHGGACCHFIPANGTFGTDYLRCFHVGAPASGERGGSGAYGGGAGGRGAAYRSSGFPYTIISSRGRDGFVGKGGSGGAGGTGTINNQPGNLMNGNPGQDGYGIGAGTATTSGVAWYDGTSWLEPTRSTNTTGAAYLKVTYLGTS